MRECCRKTRNELIKTWLMAIELRIVMLTNKIKDLDFIPDDDKTDEQKVEWMTFVCYKRALGRMKKVFEEGVEEKK